MRSASKNASFPFIGQFTEHTNVKWTIGESDNYYITIIYVPGRNYSSRRNGLDDDRLLHPDDNYVLDDEGATSESLEIE